MNKIKVKKNGQLPNKLGTRSIVVSKQQQQQHHHQQQQHRHSDRQQHTNNNFGYKLKIGQIDSYKYLKLYKLYLHNKFPKLRW